MRPIDTTPTIGQKSSSKKKKMLRDAISRWRTLKAQTAAVSARQFNEHLLHLRLPHLHAAHRDTLGVELPEQIR